MSYDHAHPERADSTVLYEEQHSSGATTRCTAKLPTGSKSRAGVTVGYGRPAPSSNNNCY